MYFPDLSDEPPVESAFFRIERRDDKDAPEMVYLWARAVLRQVMRYRDALQARSKLREEDEHGYGVSDDEFFDAWTVEWADFHFLMGGRRADVSMGVAASSDQKGLGSQSPAV